MLKNNNEHFVEPVTSVVDGKVEIPYVVTLEDNLYHAFVPGFKIYDMISSNIDEALAKLKLFVDDEVDKRIKNKQSFPFFPSDEQIKEDFEGVVRINRITYKVPQ